MPILQEISILLVEDEKDLKQLFLWDFEKFKVKIETAETYQEAKMLLQTEVFNAIISDIKLPDGTGVDLFRYIVDEQIKIPKKYFITAFTSDELDLEGLRVDRLFKKPLKTKEVVEYVANELGLDLV